MHYLVVLASAKIMIFIGMEKLFAKNIVSYTTLLCNNGYKIKIFRIKFGYTE